MVEKFEFERLSVRQANRRLPRRLVARGLSVLPCPSTIKTFLYVSRRLSELRSQGPITNSSSVEYS